MVSIVLDHWLNDAMVLMDRCGLNQSLVLAVNKVLDRVIGQFGQSCLELLSLVRFKSANG